MTDNTFYYTQIYNSPCGNIMLAECEGLLCMCDWLSCRQLSAVSRFSRSLRLDFVERQTDVLQDAVRQLDEYFGGKRRVFDLPVSLVGTEFQKRVWQGLLHIPYGVTESYSDLARRIGCPTSVRAVANAVASNLISVIVPCHRIVGIDSLAGYRGGLEAKRYLLSLESNALTNM